ncbi:choice-of-anchor Q domain-containing protein [Marinobacter sp.]|uniref:choice-of-anchor Q domain-containing protein n=1 Tax=Marinobacter sp. TaxID=50741 RepID=UPI00356A0E96
MKTRSVSRHYSLFPLALGAAMAATGAHSATLTVNTEIDVLNAGDDLCSLREAVIAINTAGSEASDCLAEGAYEPGDNTIILPEGTYRLTLPGLDEVPNTSGIEAPTVDNIPDATIGDLDLIQSMTITGAGSDTTRIEWDPAALTELETDRIFHIYTTDVNTTNVDVSIQGVTLASGQTFENNLGIANPTPDTGDSPTYYYLRRAGGALALGAAAAVVEVDPNLEGSENANAGGTGGSTGGEEGGTEYSLSLSDVVVDGNSAQGDGGGLYLAATTTATNIVVSNNTSGTNGGGLYNEANTTITNSTIRDNSAEGGGGMFVTGATPISLTGVTLTGNEAIGGGAISSRSGATVNMLNSTISGNLGSDVGGGLYTNGSANLNFVTIARNIANADSQTAGSGINTFPAGGGTVTLKNVLLEGNLAGSDEANRVPANCGKTGSNTSVASLGYNLSSDNSCVTNVDWLNDTNDTNNVDPKIEALADNGGPTLTHALQEDSPALGAGIATAGVTTDQRGEPRDATPDIGAFELPAPEEPIPPEEPTTPTTSSGGGSGGCTVNPHAPFDPLLPGLVAAAIGGLMLRRQRRGQKLS